MEEDYVSFEVAKLLEKKGFWEEVSMYYDTWDKDDIELCPRSDISSEAFSYHPDGTYVKAPTHQMACAWLREIHHIHIDIIIEGNGCCIEYKAYIRPFKLIYPTRCFDSIDTIVVGRYNTYKEAVEAGLKHCLENLI